MIWNRLKKVGDKMKCQESEELLKCKEKLRISTERLAETEAAYEEIKKKIDPLYEQMEKLKKDADYHRSRVIKYQKMKESLGGQNG